MCLRKGKNMRKIARILEIFSFIAALCAVLCVVASASLDDFTTAYGDITPENGYVHIGVHNNSAGTAAATDSDGDGKVEQYLTKGYNAYFNESTETLVLISAGTYTGDYGDWSVTSTKNTPGKTYFLAYWADKGGLGNHTKVKHIEIRGGTAFNNLSYGIQAFVSVRDIKIDSSIVSMSGQKGDTGLFHGLTALVSVGHGSFSKTDGTFVPTTYKEGVADLSGFGKIAPNGNLDFPDGVMLGGHMLNGTAVKKLILPASMTAKSGGSYPETAYVDGVLCYVLDTAKAASFSSSAFEKDGVWYSPNNNDGKNARKINAAEDIYGGEYSGIIPHSVARKCLDLREVVFGAPVLEIIEPYAFADCKNLNLLCIVGSVSEKLSVAKDAFSGVHDLTVRLNTVQDAQRFGAAIAAAGIKNIFLEIANAGDSDPVKNPLTAEGFAIRISGYNGLRGLFSFDDSKMASNALQGFSLVEYGVVATSGEIYDSLGSAEGVFSNLMADNVIRVPIYAVDGSGVNRYVDVRTKTFCVTITHIPDFNYKSDIYMMSYVLMEKDGVKYRMFCEYEYEKDGKNKRTISIFDTAWGLYRQGLISEELCPEFDTVIAPILRYGGLTLAVPTSKRKENFI